MNTTDAIDTAQQWVKIRKDVRKHLLAAAREANPLPDRAGGEGWPSSEIRKLYQYPSDLNEQRLLDLIGVEGSARCEWCGEHGNDEQGPVIASTRGQMHAGCAWSEQHGALATR